MIDLTGGNCLDLQPGEICTVYCQGPNYFGDQLGAGCPATNLDPNKVINWFPPTCFCKEPVPPPAGYLLNPTPNTYRCAPGYYGQANYRCEIDTVTCEPIVTLTGCALLAPCAPPEVPSYHNKNLGDSESFWVILNVKDNCLFLKRIQYRYKFVSLILLRQVLMAATTVPKLFF